MKSTTKESVMLKSFEFDIINDNEMRKFEAWGSVEVSDRHGEIIEASEIYKIMDIWMDRGAPIQYMHTNRNVGKGLNWQRKDKDGKPGVLITGVIYKHYKEDDEVWEGIKKGEYEGLSIGGKSYTRDETEKGTFLRDLIGYEFSVVDRCGNQEATFTGVNTMAKAEKITKEDETVMDEQSNAGSEDRISQLENTVSSLIEKISMLEEKVSGGPESDEPVEEQKEADDEEEPVAEEEEDKSESSEDEDEEEVEKTAESSKVDEISKELITVKKELEDIKKSSVAKTISTDRPISDAPLEVSKTAEVRKQIKEMSEKGKISFTELGSAMRG